MVDASVTLTPKFQNIDFAKKFGNDLLTNPPQNPLDMLKIMGSAVDIGGALNKGIGAVFPFALPILPILGGIFDLFSGPPPGPTFEELTLESIGKVSQQIATGFQTIISETQQIAEAQATRTISAVIDGVDKIARQQSAANILENTFALEILNKLEAQKLDIYTANQMELIAIREKWVSDVGSAMRDAKSKSD